MKRHHPILYAAVFMAGSAVAAPSPNPLREAYFGDLHLHTIYSFDAYIGYSAEVDPDGAFRFARGEPTTYLGEEMKRSSPPLDFLAVTDHAELVGIANELDNPDSALSRSEVGQRLRRRDFQVFRDIGQWPNKLNSVPGLDAKAIMQSAWKRTIDAANRNYQPGKFTTFIAYEWTSMPGMNTLHRNVIFRGDKAPDPFTAYDSGRPEDLWKFLESIRQQGYDALAIPHNPNISNGLAFDWVNSDGQPIDQAYAELRAANEPLVEISQKKGQSETHPALAPNDEFANFELYGDRPKAEDPPFKVPGSYVRDALGRGLVIAQRAGGANPFKYGFAGASDFHNGLSEAAEVAYAGNLSAITPTLRMLEKLDEKIGERPPHHYKLGSANLTGAWAEQNTRESIYAAFRRKETFATSGTRMKLRFFGGWDFAPALLKNRDWVRDAYRTGVSMGAELPSRTGRANAPRFVLWAVKDPNGANLDRLQVVKVWLEGGKHVERVYDVALSNGRKVDPKTGKAPPVGDTVDLRKATYTNTIGSVELSAVWSDPHFDPKVPALYYSRVLEIPTPRWSTLVAVKRGQELPQGVPPIIQERGWSSPIWFSPVQAK